MDMTKVRFQGGKIRKQNSRRGREDKNTQSQLRRVTWAAFAVYDGATASENQRKTRK